VFSTLPEGAKAKKALDWKLIDGHFPRSKFDQGVAERAAVLSRQPSSRDTAKGIKLTPLAPEVSEDQLKYRHVDVRIDRAKRLAEVRIAGPTGPAPASVEAAHALGADLWALRAFRELDDALCRLRFDFEDVGLLLFKTTGDHDAARAHADFLAAHRDDWFVSEVVLFVARTLRRLDGTAKSLFAIVEPGSAFASELLEVALACDRIYMLDDASKPVFLGIGALQGGALPMGNGLTRLESRFLGAPGHADKLVREAGKLDAPAALKAGLVTAAPDEIDWEDTVRVAIEERLSLSPDALTGMEASLRFGGPETLNTKIYGRLSAWQNWIFIRPNATGEQGALKLYGQPDRPKFDWRRT